MEAREFYQYSGIFLFPTTRSEALEALEYFVTEHLSDFGRLEDAMYRGDDTVHHSLLSVAMNIGLLSPSEVIERVEHAEAPIASRE